MSQVDAVNTPASAADIIGRIMAEGVSQQAATMLAAQSAFETAGWTAMWDWNLGNITTNNPDYFILEGDQTHHYIPFGSLQAGVAYYVRYLTAHGVMPFAEAGDVAGYAAQLKAKGYYEAPLEQYQAGLSSWYSRLGGVVPTAFFPWKTMGIMAAILGVSAATAYYILEGESPVEPIKRLVGVRENPSGKNSTEVQTLIFDRDRFTTTTAKRWARNHGFKATKTDVKPNTIRIRQHPPSGYRTFRTKRLTDGVSAVVAR